ncbi:hypothetical protein [Desulfotignum balticum]|uniref:hypothetical protein n=1 Tax=Desulfotignum balticum TaxID=115781 RepID=UPI001FE0DE19
MLEYLGEVTVAPVTSTIREMPSEVFLSVDVTVCPGIALSIVTIYRRFQGESAR